MTLSTLQAPQEVVRVFIDHGLDGAALSAWWTTPNRRLGDERPCDVAFRLSRRLQLAAAARADAPALQRAAAGPVGASAAVPHRPQPIQESRRRGQANRNCPSGS